MPMDASGLCRLSPAGLLIDSIQGWKRCLFSIAWLPKWLRSGRAVRVRVGAVLGNLRGRGTSAQKPTPQAGGPRHERIGCGICFNGLRTGMASFGKGCADRLPFPRGGLRAPTVRYIARARMDPAAAGG